MYFEFFSEGEYFATYRTGILLLYFDLLLLLLHVASIIGMLRLVDKDSSIKI